MNKLLLTLLSISASSSIVAGITLGQNKFVSAKAYTVASFPDVLDLNDSSESEIRTYYSSLTSLSVEERQGNNLLKNLKPILKNNQKYYSYDTDNNGRKVWQIYEIADRDWKKSPASEIPGYDASTNTVTGYTYGTSASKSGMNPYIRALYVDRTVENNMRAWALYDGSGKTSHGGNNEWCIDREHIWAKYHGFDTEGEGGARGDPMNLWPGDSYVNSALHNNYSYGFVDKSVTYTDGKDKYSYTSNNLMGKSLTLGDNGSTGKSNIFFEPQDSDKGDIARSIFYMVARYNYLAGDDDTIDTNNPNLALSETYLDFSSGSTSSKTKVGYMGLLQDLLAWHHLDPVDEFEIHRNNLLYKNYTNNRNPFIDFPEWVDYIWGTVTYNGRQFVSRNATPAGAANPDSDEISKGTEPVNPGTSETTTSETTTSETAPSETTSESEEKNNNTGFMAFIAIFTSMGIVGYVLLALIVLTLVAVIIGLVVLLFSSNKRTKKKVLKTTKKIVKNNSKSSSKKKK